MSWDEHEHPRNPDNGEFVNKDWAGRIVDQLGGRLQLALRSGIAREQENEYQGNSGDLLTRVEFNDGTVGIRKHFTPKSSFYRQPEEAADAEMLGTAVAQSLGVPTPELVRTAPDEILTVYIPSRPSGYAYWKKRTGLEVTDEAGRVAPGRAHTSAEFRLAVFDLLTENHDRTNPTNLRQTDDGTQYTIDHEKLFRWESDRGPARPGNLGGPGPYAAMFVTGFEDPKWAVNPLSSADIAWIRSRLEAVRPQFEAAGRMDWWDGMSARLEAVAQKARGTESLL